MKINFIHLEPLFMEFKNKKISHTLVFVLLIFFIFLLISNLLIENVYFTFEKINSTLRTFGINSSSSKKKRTLDVNINNIVAPSSSPKRKQKNQTTSPKKKDSTSSSNTSKNQKHKINKKEKNNKYIKQVVSNTKSENETRKIGNNIIDQSVPFTPQAPFADWEDPRQQDGCEEASVLMAIKWARGEGLNKQQALDSILDMAKFQKENYGYYRDTSASGTISHIIKGYFNYNHTQLESEVNRENIIEALENEKLVIVPTNGKKLNNPYFSGDGPERHMLVIRGFDFETEEFIVNDPGTRRGEAFRYSVKNLLNSIRDYPSGKDKKITKIEQNMIVFSKSN